MEDLQRQAAGLAGGDRICVIDPGQPEETRSDSPWEKPTHVLVEGGSETIEGQIVKGVRDADGSWDLDTVFTVQTEDGDLIRVNGWACTTEVL
jgi:hypothetical protein